MDTARDGIRNILTSAVADYRSRKLRAFIYGRTSSDPHLRRSSTRDQAAENRRTCEENGWDVAGSFEDPDRSASRRAKKPRPDYEAMVEGIRRGECDVIVYWDSSRAYRDLETYVQLRSLCVECNVLLCYNGDVYDMSKPADRKRSAMDAVQDESEADRIADRAMRTKRLSAERGAPHGRIPFGYRREYDPRTGILVGQFPDEETSALVREAAARVLSGESLHAIAKDFQDRGIPCARGSKTGWERTALKRILINPANIGKRVHQEAVVGDADWAPILDDVTYYTCRQMLTDPSRRTQRGSEVKYLLSGVVACHCGGQVYARKRINDRGGAYTCVTRFDTAVEVELLDAYVQTAMLAHIEKPAFLRAFLPDDGATGIREAMGVLAELESQLHEARLLVGARKLSVASLASVEGQLAPQIDAARLRIQAVTVSPLLQQVGGPRARDAWAGLDLLQRREVLRSVVRITLNNARHIGIKEIEEGRVSLEWLR
jgi:DNA invertase Pin-like site-specific DNA recombinase